MKKKYKIIQKPKEIVQSNIPMTPEALISQAIQKGVSVDTMERLLVMRRELKQEYAKAEFDKAMASFQAECPIIEKTKEVKTNNGTIAYKFAPIDSILSQVKPLIQKNGFSYFSNMEIISNGTTQIKVIVKVTHSAGHSELTEMTVPLGTKTNIMSDTQVVAAAQTFAKRYAFCNAFGILTGDDDNDAVVKAKGAKSLDIDTLKKINSSQTYDELIAVCKEIQLKNPNMRDIIVAEYTRRKNELSDELANQADAAIK